VREGLREEPQAHQVGRIGMLWDRERGTPFPSTGAGLVAAGVEDQRDDEQPGGDDDPQQQHGLLQAQARV